MDRRAEPTRNPTSAGPSAAGPVPHRLAPKAPPSSADRRHEVSDALLAVRDGRAGAMERLMPLVYGELRAVARRRLRAERAGHTLTTTALVHEAWLRLADARRLDWEGRAQFFAIAARAMRRVLVDYARKHRAQRRGRGIAPVSLSALDSPMGAALAEANSVRAKDLLALHDALERLSRLDPRLAAVVEQRFFAGLTVDEIAQLQGVTSRTVERQWSKARAWLAIDLGGRDA